MGGRRGGSTLARRQPRKGSRGTGSPCVVWSGAPRPCPYTPEKTAQERFGKPSPGVFRGLAPGHRPSLSWHSQLISIFFENGYKSLRTGRPADAQGVSSGKALGLCPKPRVMQRITLPLLEKADKTFPSALNRQLSKPIATAKQNSLAHCQGVLFYR